MQEAAVVLTISGRAIRAAVYLSHRYLNIVESFWLEPAVALLVSEKVDFARRWHSRGFIDRLNFKERESLEMLIDARDDITVMMMLSSGKNILSERVLIKWISFGMMEKVSVRFATSSQIINVHSQQFFGATNGLYS